MNEANYLVNAGYVNPSNMFSDYETVQIAIGAGIKAASIGCTIDKEGNVYATMAFAPGVSIGGHITIGAGFLSDKTDGYINAIPGWSGNFSVLGIIGGNIGISSAGISGELDAGDSIGLSASVGYTWYVGNVYG